MVFCCILHCFVGKLVFSLSIYAVLSQNCFLRLTRFCVEKNLAKNSARGEKMTNMRYAFRHPLENMGQEWGFHRQYNEIQIMLNHRDEVNKNTICPLSYIYIYANGQCVIPDTRILINPTCILAIVCDMLSWLSAFNNTCNWGELGAQRTSGSGQALTSDRTAEQLTLLLGEQCPLAFAPRVHCAL